MKRSRAIYPLGRAGLSRPKTTVSAQWPCERHTCSQRCAPSETVNAMRLPRQNWPGLEKSIDHGGAPFHISHTCRLSLGFGDTKSGTAMLDAFFSPGSSGAQSAWAFDCLRRCDIAEHVCAAAGHCAGHRWSLGLTSPLWPTGRSLCCASCPSVSHGLSPPCFWCS
jgi:hypothetical protein